MTTKRSTRVVLGCAVLALVTLIAYAPALAGGFIWDDDSLLTQNALIKAGDGLYRIWFTTAPIDYWPVTSTSFWLEWRLWGMNPAGYHATNLALHIAEALLLWAVLRRLEIPGAFVAALLFAVHPVNVESVAWIAERKNLMAMLFYLASAWFFAGWLNGGRRASSYWLSLAAFVLAMLSKGSVAMLPVVFLGLIAWRRRPGPADGLRLLPFFAASAILTGVNVWFQGHYLVAAIRDAGWLDRLLGAGAVIWFYFSKALLPLNLVFVYPGWRIHAGELSGWAPLFAAAAFTWFLARSARSREFGAWGYFCVSLVPVMGFTDVYFMKYAPVADHYQHLAIIGVVAFLGWAWSRWPAASGVKAAAAGAAVCALGALTFIQCQAFHDSETLFHTTLLKSPGNWMADVNLGLIELDSGRNEAAMGDFSAAIRMKPDLAEAWSDLGIALTHLRRAEEAVPDFEEAERLNPKYPEAFNGLGLALLALNRLPEAAAQCQRAIALRPGYPEAHNSLGIVLARQGRLDEATAEFEAAVRANPAYVNARNNLGGALASAGRFAEAEQQFEESLRINPTGAEACFDLGNCLLQEGKPDEAVAWYEKAVRLRPSYAQAEANLGYALRKLGREEEAEEHLEAAARMGAVR